MNGGALSSATGLIRYDAMCTAIAVCSQVDEAKDIRDKARALEVYAKQALNTEAERKAGEIRLRAERRAGELLKEMKASGERASSRDNLNQGPKSNGPTSGKRLSDLGITRDQSSQWQKLAAIPEPEFETEIRKPGPKPTTEGLLNSRRAPDAPERPSLDPTALWVWGRIRDFERAAILQGDPAKTGAAFTDAMRYDVERILPDLINWLRNLQKEL